MKEEKPFERIPPVLPGDEVLRRQRRPHRRLRVAPNVPGIFRFLRHIVTQTPFLPMIFVLVFLWLVFSAGLYFAERGASGSGINHYTDGLWWGVVAMTSMGTAPMPVTGMGHIVGGIWSVLGCILFYGTIIASVTAYFLIPHRRPTTQIINTIQYNLGQLEDLSVEELETLKGTTVGLIEAQMERLKERPSPGK